MRITSGPNEKFMTMNQTVIPVIFPLFLLTAATDGRTSSCSAFFFLQNMTARNALHVLNMT